MPRWRSLQEVVRNFFDVNTLIDTSEKKQEDVGEQWVRYHCRNLTI